MQQAASYRRERQFVRLLWFWGFVCVNQRDLRETYWGFLCADILSTLACYSPADSADDAEECSPATFIRKCLYLKVIVYYQRESVCK